MGALSEGAPQLPEVEDTRSTKKEDVDPRLATSFFEGKLPPASRRWGDKNRDTRVVVSELSSTPRTTTAAAPSFVDNHKLDLTPVVARYNGRRQAG